MSKYLFTIYLFSAFSTSAQKPELIKYLNAYKISEFEEAQKIISEYSFGQKADYTLSEYSDFEGFGFDTDIDGVKGFKAIGNCKVKNKAGGFIDKRMMVVMYFDKIKKHWSVFSLTEVADSNHEYEIAKADVEAYKFYTSKEFVYRNLAYWCLMSAHINDGKKYIQLAIESSKDSKSPIPFTTQTDVVIKSII